MSSWLTILAQTLSQTLPVTTEAAYLSIIAAIAISTPFILRAFTAILNAYARRINVGSDKQLTQLDSFRILKEEVEYLRQKRAEDEQLITKLYAKVASLQSEIAMFRGLEDTKTKLPVLTDVDTQNPVEGP